MKLTPLKIPGKRCQKDDNNPVAVTPRKRAKLKSKSKSHLQKSAEENASYLELMPLEIVERIFWLSENVNLPRASPRIGRLLSGSFTRQETFIIAFEPTWDACLGISALLEFSWVDISFILSCWDRYIVRRAKQLRLDSHASINLRFQLGQHTPPVNALQTTGESSVAGTSDNFWADYRLFRDLETWEGDHRRVHVGHQLELFTASTLYQVNANTRIPDKLLCSAKSETDLQKLFWLVRGGASLAPDQNWECTQEAFRNAFPEGMRTCGQLSYALMGIHFMLGTAQGWPAHVFSEAIAALNDLETNSQLGVLRRFRYHLEILQESKQRLRNTSGV
ncbi:uncharacterized protein F4807DRAFT_457391 [Annulohypoxylon truncatum]|uniref:uncharacterized protein n=1 Tax=Annulohypoxylon truncatum TaxID=327061 RepID=UPI00200726FA|nr:uncharacterized protein F4807DRAFT_457391 [Annulohypoxylon truncatum]KAI1212593.1 hypothetical protein F4807DRAFT_457391 [Annulohypoxylon truncatum]